MSTLSRILAVGLVVLILGGAVFLLTWEIPPPTARIERTIPGDQLTR